jgi:N-acetylmuramoyl-L-alanine amidase
MVKINSFFRLTLLTFFFVTSLFASYAQIDSLSYQIKTQKRHDALKSYNTLKNIYLKTLISGNKALQKRALIALVDGGKRLGQDVSAYQKKLGVEYQQRTKVTRKPTPKRKPQTISSRTNRLKSIKPNKEDIELFFTHPIKNRDINHFVLKMYKPKKYVFDLNAQMFQSTQYHKLSGQTSIKVGKFEKSKTRIVITSKSTIKPRLYIDNNRIKIKLNISKRAVKKVSKSKQKPKAPAKVTPPKAAKSVITNRNDKIVVIDAGHGGKDSGAVGKKRHYEKNAVLAVAKRVADKLRSRGYRVYLTRTSDKFIKLKKRTKYANKKHAHIFVSIHANAVRGKSRQAKAHGIETYFLTNNSLKTSKRAKSVALLENKNDIEAMAYQSKETYLNFLSNSNRIASNKLAIDVQRGMKQNLSKRYSQIHDGGVREGPFWVLVGAQMPSILIEIGYITHPVEGNRLFNKNYQNHLAEGISNGIDNYFLKN